MVDRLGKEEKWPFFPSFRLAQKEWTPYFVLSTRFESIPSRYYLLRRGQAAARPGLLGSTKLPKARARHTGSFAGEYPVMGQVRKHKTPRTAAQPAAGPPESPEEHTATPAQPRFEEEDVPADAPELFGSLSQHNLLGEEDVEMTLSEEDEGEAAHYGSQLPGAAAKAAAATGKKTPASGQKKVPKVSKLSGGAAVDLTSAEKAELREPFKPLKKDKCGNDPYICFFNSHHMHVQHELGRPIMCMCSTSLAAFDETPPHARAVRICARRDHACRGCTLAHHSVRWSVHTNNAHCTQTLWSCRQGHGGASQVSCSQRAHP